MEEGRSLDTVEAMSVSMLVLNGAELMELTGENPGPRIGWVLHALLEDVMKDSENNTKKYLEQRARELCSLTDAELKELGGKEEQEDAPDSLLGKSINRIFKKVLAYSTMAFGLFFIIYIIVKREIPFFDFIMDGGLLGWFF